MEAVTVPADNAFVAVNQDYPRGETLVPGAFRHQLDQVARGCPGNEIDLRSIDLDLDVLRRPLANHQIVSALHVLDDRLVQLIAGGADAAGVNDAGKGNQRHFRGAAADVDDHVGGGFIDRESDADGGGHGLRNGDDVACSGVHGGFFDGAFFHFGDT